jgi:hypothetical protein
MYPSHSGSSKARSHPKNSYPLNEKHWFRFETLQKAESRLSISSNPCLRRTLSFLGKLRKLKKNKRITVSSLRKKVVL